MSYQPGKFMPTSEVAARWGVSLKTVQRLVEAGALKAVKFGTRNFSFLAKDIEQYEQLKMKAN